MVDLHSELDDGVLVLNPSGRIDGATAKAYEEALLDHISSGHNQILINCESVEYISSAGLRVLLMASRRADQLVLCAVRDHVHDVFKFSGFADIIPIHEDQQTARAAF